MSNANVLVVEDDDTLRRLLIEYLKSYSYVAIRGARDGVEALHEILQGTYAVVILDLMMPKMSGVDVLDSITAHRSDPSVKSVGHEPAILVITAAAESAAPDEAIFRRCPLVREVLRKPIELESLARCVDEHLRSAS